MSERLNDNTERLNDDTLGALPKDKELSDYLNALPWDEAGVLLNKLWGDATGTDAWHWASDFLYGLDSLTEAGGNVEGWLQSELNAASFAAWIGRLYMADCLGVRLDEFEEEHYVVEDDPAETSPTVIILG